MSCQILTDADVSRILSMSLAVEVMEEAFHRHAAGTLIAPARISSDLEIGQLVFTVGATKNESGVVGFRAYDLKQLSSTNRDELTAVFSGDDGALQGLVIGPMLGAIRTGAIGGVAVKYLSLPDSKVLGLIGTGFQACTQLEAALAVRKFDTIKAYSRNADNRNMFAEEMSAKFNCKIVSVDSAAEACADADVLLCTTTCSTPVVEVDWLKPGVHINNVGPKFKDSQEVGIEVAERADHRVTDTFAQMDAFGDRFILTGTSLANSVVDLADVVAGNVTGRTSSDEMTLFYSLGLAGTEVLLADRLFDRRKPSESNV